MSPTRGLLSTTDGYDSTDDPPESNWKDIVNNDVRKRTGELRPQVQAATMQNAEEAGTLMQLLQVCQAPLAQYPHIASMYALEAISGFSDLAQFPGAGEQPGSLLPTGGASVLANFLRVPGSVPEAVLQALLEPMVVFRKGLMPLRASSNFPEELGAIFMNRAIHNREVPSITYRSSTHTLEFANGDILQASAEYPITLPEAARRDAMIPRNATSFVFLYPGGRGAFDTGGFLYLRGDGQPVAVNSISFSYQRCAFSFGPYESVGQQATKELERIAKDVTAEALLDSGVKQFAWIGPKEKYADGLSGGDVGGFAYLFHRPEKNRFFPLLGAAEVVDLGSISWEVNTAVLDVDATGPTIEEEVASVRSPLSCVPVDFARLKVPGVLHPVVLHGLAFCPSTNALETLAAKAIASSAYAQARNMIRVDLAMEAMSLGAITWCARSVRKRDGGSSGDFSQWQWHHWLSVGIISFVFVKNALVETSLIRGYWQWGWSRDYMSRHRALGWIKLMLSSLLLFQFAARRTAAHRDEDRALLALLGCMKWVTLLYGCRGFQHWKIGLRILPVLAALSEVASFLMVMIFFFGASYSASYALTDAKMSEIVTNTYRMQFTGELEESLFLSGESGPVWFYEHIAYFVFGFLIMAAMANIFIGIMSNAFDYYQDKVTALFVRSRASMGLDYALLRQRLFLYRRGGRGGLSEEDYVWLCYLRKGEDDASDSDITLRSSLNALQQHVSPKLDTLLQRLDKLEALLRDKNP